MRREGETPSVRGSLPPAPRPRFSRLCSRCSSLSRSRRLRASPCAAGLAPRGRGPSASETWCPRRRSRAAGCGKTRQAAASPTPQPPADSDSVRCRILHHMLPNMPHSRMPPTPPLRPSHPWPGVARGLGPRVKGRVLPNSPKSAPLTGGRFRRPAKTHEGTPSGAHFSGHCQVWRPAGGTKGVPGRRSRVREPPA